MTNKYCLQIHQILIIEFANSIESQSTRLGICEDLNNVLVVECIQPGRMHCHPRQVADPFLCHTGEEPFELTEAPLPLIRRDRIGQDKLNKNLRLTEDNVHVSIQVIHRQEEISYFKKGTITANRSAKQMQLILGTRSKKKERGTLQAHKKGTIQ